MVWEAVYLVGRSIVITAGRPTPQAGWSKPRGGVAIVLSGPAIDTWKKGEQWKTWGSRLIKGHTWYWKAKLRLLACTFVLCANFAASRDVKEAF